MISTLQPACFTLEFISDRTFSGYSNGQIWNGWACPLFTLEEGFNIVSVMKENQTAFYDEEADAFFFGADEESLEPFGAVDVKGAPRLYPIGAYSWIWEQLSAVETEQR